MLRKNGGCLLFLLITLTIVFLGWSIIPNFFQILPASFAALQKTLEKQKVGLKLVVRIAQIKKVLRVGKFIQVKNLPNNLLNNKGISKGVKGQIIQSSNPGTVFATYSGSVGITGSYQVSKQKIFVLVI